MCYIFGKLKKRRFSKSMTVASYQGTGQGGGVAGGTELVLDYYPKAVEVSSKSLLGFIDL